MTLLDWLRVTVADTQARAHMDAAREVAAHMGADRDDDGLAFGRRTSPGTRLLSPWKCRQCGAVIAA
jgi:hypothetical protein